ncbi:MAG: SMC-Scp complex subunit ScpB [Pseudomonadota bacterium]
MQDYSLEHVVEAALLAASEPLTIDQLVKIVLARPGAEKVGKAELREALKALTDAYASRGLELIEVASGFRVQVTTDMARQLVGLHEERPPRYSRAFFETLALIAYRQPITRGEIEDVRGVAVSSNIVRSMLDREWVRVVGHRDVPGKPAMFGTTKAFLDYFNLKSLDDLPSLAELTDIESLRIQLDLPTVDDGSTPAAAEQSDADSAQSAVEATCDDGRESESTEDAAAEDNGTDDRQATGEGDDVAASPARIDAQSGDTTVDGDDSDESQDLTAPAGHG